MRTRGLLRTGGVERTSDVRLPRRVTLGMLVGGTRMPRGEPEGKRVRRLAVSLIAPAWCGV